MVTILIWLVTFQFDKTWSDPLAGWTQHTSRMAGSGPRVQVEIDTCGVFCHAMHVHSGAYAVAQCQSVKSQCFAKMTEHIIKLIFAIEVSISKSCVVYFREF